MKVAVVVCALFALASGAAIYPASTIVRTPQYDSAVIKHDRLGGNFAYSATEAHAYASINPVVQNIVSPVGVSYHATPIQYPAYPAYMPAIQPAYAPAMIASPIAPIAPIAPVYPSFAVPAMPVATPIEDTPAAAPAPVEPVAPMQEDSVDSSASSDDSVSIEAA